MLQFFLDIWTSTFSVSSFHFKLVHLAQLNFFWILNQTSHSIADHFPKVLFISDFHLNPLPIKNLLFFVCIWTSLLFLAYLQFLIFLDFWFLLLLTFIYDQFFFLAFWSHFQLFLWFFPVCQPVWAFVISIFLILTFGVSIC